MHDVKLLLINPLLEPHSNQRDSLSQQMDFTNGKKKASKNNPIISDKVMENLLHLLDFTIPGDSKMKKSPLSPY